jgi:transcriptional regulator with XRE-family HTH domain
MIIGERLRLLREGKNLSQGEIQERTGLLRCYISRVENGHTVPSVETLEKMARGLEMPLYQLLYEAPETAEIAKLSLEKRSSVRDGWGIRGKNARFLARLRRCLSQMRPCDRAMLMVLVSELVKQKTRRNRQSIRLL